jgi:hypothetical protein
MKNLFFKMKVMTGMRKRRMRLSEPEAQKFPQRVKRVKRRDLKRGWQMF